MAERGRSESAAEEATAAPADDVDERRALAERMMRELAEIERRLDERASVAAAHTPGRAAIGQINLRRKPRFEVAASVLIDHDGHSETLRLLNVSLTGGLVALTGSALHPPRVGALLFITLFATQDPGHRVDVNARVVRHDDKGLALDWSDHYATTHAVAVLLDRLSG